MTIRDTESTAGVTPQVHESIGRDGIALCLSGGGFRAALFHLGALRRLHEIGLLGKLKTISSVSGGSIISGYLAELMIRRKLSSLSQIHDFESEVAVDFRKIVSQDFRTWPVLRNVLWNWAIPNLRSTQMEDLFKSRISKHALGELPSLPRFVFCATDMVFGVSWEFTNDRVGDYRVGYSSNAKQWPIARAITASASFPPLFGPLALKLTPGDFKGGSYHGADRDELCRDISLTDGGVYDNMALEPVWKSHECVLVSDCGGPFSFSVTKSYFKRLYRYTSIMANQAEAMRKRAYFEAIKTSPYPALFRGGYWGLGGTVDSYANKSSLKFQGYSAALVDEVLFRIRTDLDNFTEAEMHALENHGYSLNSAVIACYREELLGGQIPNPPMPHQDLVDEARVREALKGSENRLSLERLFGK